MVVFACVVWAGLHWNESSAMLAGALGVGCSVALIVLAGNLLMAGLLAELIAARKMTEQEPYGIAELTLTKTDSS